MININICPLCGSENLEEFYKGIDCYYSGKNVRCSACKNCSLIFLNPRPTEDEYENWYRTIFQNQRRNINTVAEVVAGIKRKKKYKRKQKELKYFKKFVNKDSKCLEVGCGWGTLARVVKDKFDCDIDVIEPSALGAKTAKEYFKLNSYNCSFEEFFDNNPPADGEKQYDFIYLYHVFEHIREPNDFLKKIKKILKPDGSLLLAMPNAMNPEQPSEKFFHIDHCFYYTPNTLKNILNKNGFKIIKLWRCRKDMKIVCAPDEEIKVKDFKNYEIEKIKEKNKNFDKKFKILKKIKKIICSPLGSKNRERISRVICYFRRIT